VTKTAIDLLLLAVDNLHVGRVNIFLDAPVSNSEKSADTRKAERYFKIWE